MRKRRGMLFIVVGLVLAGLAGYAVLSFARQAAANAAANAAAVVAASAPVQAQPLPKVFVVVAAKDIPENVAISTEDVTKAEFPAEFAPVDAIATPEIAIGKYTTARIFKGQIVVAPLLTDSRRSGALAASVPQGKVALAVVVNDAMNALGALRPGDRVDILLTINLKDLVAVATPQASQAANQASGQAANQAASSPPELSTQVTMQNVEILAIGAPAGDQPPANAQAQGAPQGPSQQQQQSARTITFLLDHQDAITLKFIKDSGGTMDLVVRAPKDTELAKTDAVTLDSIYRKYSFRFVQPVGG